MISHVVLHPDHSLSFQALVDGNHIAARVPKLFVDKEIGEMPSLQECKDYLERNTATIVIAVRTKKEGGYLREPLNAIRLR